MPFNLLLLSTLQRGTTLPGDGNQVSMKPQNDEKVLFFKIDDRDCALTAALRERKPQSLICDGLILYLREQRLIICLVELKGKDVAHAVNQILGTYDSVKPFLEESLQKTNIGRSILRKVEWAAYICQHRKSSAPSKKSNERKTKTVRDSYKRLDEKFGGGYEVSKDKDIGKFLRKV